MVHWRRHLESRIATRVAVAVALTMVCGPTLLAGCHSASTQSGKRAVSFRPPAGLDHSLINAVLDDLVNSNVFRLGGSNDPTRYELILHVQSRMPTSILSTQKVRSEARLSQVKVAKKLCDNLVERNKEPVSLAGFRPRNPDVVIRDLSGVDGKRRYLVVKQFKTKFPNARGFVQTWMPGYSQDGNTAIVRFRCGPPRDQQNSAGQVGTFLFSRRGDHWEVQWRMFHPV